MKIIVSSVFVCLLVNFVHGQPICGFDDAHKKMLADPSYAEKMRISERQIQEYIANNPNPPQPNGLATALYVIPVVIHVVHTGDEVGTIYNPSEAQLQAAVAYLNQVYDGTAAGFSGGAGDIQIQFKLAQRDPNCNPTNGIDRVDGSVLAGYTTFGVRRYTANGTTDATLKNQSRWDPSRYYNIWCVNKIDAADGTSGQFIVGYSAFAGSDPGTDGVVMLATQLKANNKGLPHEVGHALNLYHPFEGSNISYSSGLITSISCPVNSSPSTQGDLVTDTDPVKQNYVIGTAGTLDFTCRTGTNTCTGTAYNSYTENNVMNYTNCFTLFTPGQKARMLAAMSLSSRISLATSNAVDPTYASALQCAPKINFTTSKITVFEAADFTSDCRGYRDYTLTMTIGNSPTANATVTLYASGTATTGADYVVTTNGDFTTPSNTIIFPAGERTNKTFTVRIFDDAAVESQETVIIGFNVNNGGGNAEKGSAITSTTININSNDTDNPQPSVAQTAKIGTYTANLTLSGINHPFDSRQTSMRNSFLYKASELTAAGLSAGSITAFGVYLQKNSTRPFTNMQVRIGSTSLNYLVDGSVTDVTGTIVKSYPSYNTINGLNLFQLDVPFVWNGISNLVVQICYDNGSPDLGQVSDICQGYSDGGAASQGNLFWQNDIGCSTAYSSVTYTGSGYKPVGYFVIGTSGPKIETNLNASSSSYLGPYDNVYFYSATGDLIARIKNLTDFDYGCTQVKIDRAGTGAKAYTSNTSPEYVADKTVQVIPTTDYPNGSYEITLYYKQAEIQGWKAVAGKNFNAAQILKTPGAVSSYTPGSVPPGIVRVANPAVGTYGVDSSLNGTFSGGFSGFAIGNPAIPAPVIFIFNGNGLWTNPANWTGNAIPPAVLPMGYQIIINPVSDGQCILNTAQTVQPGGSLVVNQNKTFIIQGKLNVVK